MYLPVPEGFTLSYNLLLGGDPLSTSQHLYNTRIHKGVYSMNGQEIVKKLEAYFDQPLPDPSNYPNSFKYYIRVYRYNSKET